MKRKKPDEEESTETDSCIVVKSPDARPMCLRVCRVRKDYARQEIVNERRYFKCEIVADG